MAKNGVGDCMSQEPSDRLPPAPKSLGDVLDSLTQALSGLVHFWRECHNYYHDPQSFGFSLEALIQQLRNFTWRVQAHKADIPRFEQWYDPWQEWMMQSAIFRWINDSRIIVVKKRGLSPESIAFYSIFSSYDAPLLFKRQLDPFISTSAAVSDIREHLPKQLRKDAIVEVRRVWEDQGLPGVEILEATAESIRVMQGLTASLQLFVSKDTLVPPEFVVVTYPPLPFLIPPYRATRFTMSLNRMQFLDFQIQPLEMGDELAETVLERYGDSTAYLPEIHDPDDIESFVKFLLAMALRKLEIDGYLIPVVWLHHPKRSWSDGPRFAVFRDRAEKYYWWHQIAREVSSFGYDAMVYAHESWLRELPEGFWDDLQLDDIDSLAIKGEQLIVGFATKDGKSRQWTVPIDTAVNPVRIEREA
jgi:hypothetical protein